MHKRAKATDRASAGNWQAGLMLFALGSLLVVLAGCARRPCIRTMALAQLEGEQFSGAYTATPIFNPPIPQMDSQPVELAPMEAFNWRADWPAISGVRSAEVTFYNVSIYDRQSSRGWWWTSPGAGGADGYFSRTFRSWRSGMIVK